MEVAPNMRDWEFRYCKPPQDWDYSFEIYDKSLVKTESMQRLGFYFK